MSASIRASSLYGFEDLVRSLGGDPDLLLRMAGIRRGVLDDETNVYPLRAFIALLEHAARELKCADFGMRLASVHGGRHLGALGIMGMHSSTVGDALHEILSHLDYHCPAVVCRLDTGSYPGKTVLTWDFALGGVRERTQIDESAVANTYQELRILTQGMFAPVMVLFRHAPTKPIAVYENYFHAPVFFGQQINGVAMYSTLLTRKLAKADPLLHKLATAYVGEGAGLQKMNVGEQVEHMVKRLLPTMRCRLADVAPRLCMHERTLQRKLKESELVFEDILDKARRSRARELLGDSALSMAHIAAELGYAEQASFNRACARWFRATPTRTQHKLRSAARKPKRRATATSARRKKT
ncbi:MAG: AraC family transcriptional regulator ligand-binding domain-containing protein [Rudaea sp.]|uniref:AraC family transcriptional regulator n=1 Tax=Rudaea sp. TaxID=2136325 RepID=UPI0039E49BB2